MLVTWQPCPVWFGVQEVRGEEMGGVTYLGCIQWGLVVVGGGNAGAGR